MKAALAELLHNPLLWQGDRLARAEDAVASGFAALDRELPGGGWPQASLTELLLDHQGIGELRLRLPPPETPGGRRRVDRLDRASARPVCAGVCAARHRPGPGDRRRVGGGEKPLVVGRAGAAREQRGRDAVLAESGQ